MASNTKATETKAAMTAEDEEWMDGATSAFPSIENLAPSVPPSFGPGRLVAIWALSNGTAISAQTQKPYGYTETITLVLDNGPDGNQTDELIGAAPQRLEMRHSTTGLHTRLRGRVEGRNAKGIPLKYRPMVGRVNTQASRNNKNVAAYSISEPTAKDMEIARQYKDMITAINAELEAKDKSDEDSAAFE